MYCRNFEGKLAELKATEDQRCSELALLFAQAMKKENCLSMSDLKALTVREKDDEKEKERKAKLSRILHGAATVDNKQTYDTTLMSTFRNWLTEKHLFHQLFLFHVEKSKLIIYTSRFDILFGYSISLLYHSCSTIHLSFFNALF